MKQKVELYNCDFNIKSGDLIYLDPPYHNTFTGYTKDTFGQVQQEQLKTFIDYLTEIL